MHLRGQKFSGVLEKVFLYFFVFWLKCKKTTFLKIKGFLSKMFYQIKMQTDTNGSGLFKKHQTFQFFSNDRFLCNF